jgi:histidine phosphotransferase ChpT
MPDYNETALAEAVCARMCHDVIGPMGAVHNGVELAEESETKAEAEDIMAMVKDSAKQAWGRLSFFRAAFGSGGGQERWYGKDMEALLEGALATKRLSFARSGSLAQADFALGLDNARLLFGLAMAAAECLPSGGTVTILAGGAADKPMLAAMGEGDRAELKDEMTEALNGAAPDARTAHLSLLHIRSKALDRTIKAEAEGRKTTWQAVAR